MPSTSRLTHVLPGWLPPPIQKLMKLRSMANGLLVSVPIWLSLFADVLPGAEAWELTTRVPGEPTSPCSRESRDLRIGPRPKAVPVTSQPS